MELTSQRELRAIDPTWTIADLMTHLVQALQSDGPALCLDQSQLKSVANSIALVVPTSGSTGVRKEVGLSAEALLASAKGANKYLDAKPGQTWSLLLPLTHIAGINVIIRSLELRTTPLDLRSHTGKYPTVDFTSIVPTQLYRALHSDPDLLEHLQGAQTVLVGGSALAHNLRNLALAAKINIVETYGMTETSGGCFYNGTPLQGVSVKISMHGTIEIAGPTIASTYLNAPQLWEEVYQDGWFLTTDLGIIENGSLKVAGRIDDIVISGGENVSLSAVEKELESAYPELIAAAFPIVDKQWGESICIAIAGTFHPNEDEIKSTLVKSLGVGATPKGFIYLEELPKSALGKIERGKLIEKFTGSSS
jgi:O-succinylbenzoic acid--CoA ligase